MQTEVGGKQPAVNPSGRRGRWERRIDTKAHLLGGTTEPWRSDRSNRSNDERDTVL